VVRSEVESPVAVIGPCMNGIGVGVAVLFADGGNMVGKFKVTSS